MLHLRSLFPSAVVPATPAVVPASTAVVPACSAVSLACSAVVPAEVRPLDHICASAYYGCSSIFCKANNSRPVEGMSRLRRLDVASKIAFYYSIAHMKIPQTCYGRPEEKDDRKRVIGGDLKYLHLCGHL